MRRLLNNKKVEESLRLFYLSNRCNYKVIENEAYLIFKNR